MKLEDIPTVLLVASGKGGVGKTTVATDLARVARDAGLTVGLVDADISTPNSPEVLGGEEADVENQRLATHDALVAPEVGGIQVMSKGIVLPDDVPILRDAGWRSEAVADYLVSTEWADDTDLLVVDSPPGTGEELKTVVGVADPDYGVVVSTPHPSAIRDATKTHEYFTTEGIPHSAVLNMAWIRASEVIDEIVNVGELTEIDGVGHETAQNILDMFRDDAQPFPLFGSTPNTAPDAPFDFAARVPYSTASERRMPPLRAFLAEHTPVEGVTA